MKKGVRMDGCDLLPDDEVRMLSEDECKRLINDRIYAKWQSRWDDSENGRVTYGFIRDMRFASESEATW